MGFRKQKLQPKSAVKERSQMSVMKPGDALCGEAALQSTA